MRGQAVKNPLARDAKYGKDSDAYGTIEPTSLATLVEAKAPATEPYIVACGGSTTESAPIEPRDRWVTVLSERLGVAAINAGASAKTMATCARTLDRLLGHVPPDRQPLIMISTSVKTGPFRHIRRRAELGPGHAA